MLYLQFVLALKKKKNPKNPELSFRKINHQTYGCKDERKHSWCLWLDLHLNLDLSGIHLQSCEKKDIFCLPAFWSTLVAQLVELEPHAERSCPVILHLSYQYNPNKTKLMTYNNWLARRGQCHWFQKQPNCMSEYEQLTHLPLKWFPSVNNFSLSLWSQSPLVSSVRQYSVILIL